LKRKARVQYVADLEKKKASAKAQYVADPEKKRLLLGPSMNVTLIAGKLQLGPTI